MDYILKNFTQIYEKLNEEQRLKLTTKDAFIKYTEHAANKIFKNIQKHMNEQLLLEKAIEDEFMARLNQKWYKAFAISRTFYYYVKDSSTSHLDYYKNLSKEEQIENQYLFSAMSLLNGRALQQYFEIMILIENGLADGAYARWRSLYELSVIATFINDNGEKTAKSFIESEGGRDYYNWAKVSDVFKETNIKKIRFNDIRKNCNLNDDIRKKQYQLSCDIIHPTWQATIDRLGGMGKEDQILVGKSDYGITIPACHSSISLGIVNNNFLSVYATGDSIVDSSVILKLTNMVKERYYKTHDEVFPDDIPLWNKHDDNKEN